MRQIIAQFAGWFYAVFALLVWGVTFANMRALLFDFSALEIMVVRSVMAWVALWGMGVVVDGDIWIYCRANEFAKFSAVESEAMP